MRVSEEEHAVSLEAFVRQAVHEYQSPLISYTHQLLHNLESARDVVQEAFVRLCQQDIDSLRGHLRPWLFTVCRNQALNLLRQQQKIRPLDEVQWTKVAGDDLPPDQAAQHHEQLHHLHRILDRLSEHQREVILLKFQQGLSYREITEITGLKSGNIGFLIHTGLKRIRELLPTDPG